MSSSDSDVLRAWTSFYREYGLAMVAWQSVESELATLFSILTKIPPAMAIQIFYSARSFNGRIDIFDAALTASEASDEAKSFTRALIKKAKKYSEYRNKFAHDQPLLHQYGSPAKFRVLMVDGKGQFQSDEVKKQYVEAAAKVSDITEAGDCFVKLAKLIREFWAQSRAARTASLDKLREQFLALPNLPRTKGQSTVAR